MAQGLQRSVLKISVVTGICKACWIKVKPFFGESRFEFQRTQPAVSEGGSSVSTPSSSDLSVVRAEDKEGLAEFLRGIVRVLLTLPS